MFNDWDEYGAAAQAYADRFGENPPLIEMPDDPAEQLEIIRAALDAGVPYRHDVPPDAVI